MLTVSITVQTEDGPESLDVAQDHVLLVCDRLRDFEARYTGKQLPLPAEFSESQKLNGRLVKIKYAIEQSNAKAQAG